MKDSRVKTVEKLNNLLSGEYSASETYKQALEKVQDDPKASDLREIQSDHVMAIQLLKDEVRYLGGEPSRESGLWGKWAQSVVGTAKIFGDKSAIKALQEGEEHGKKQYEEMLEPSNEIPPRVQELIKTTLLPQQEQHIRKLRSVMGEISS